MATVTITVDTDANTVQADVDGNVMEDVTHVHVDKFVHDFDEPGSHKVGVRIVKDNERMGELKKTTIVRASDQEAQRKLKEGKAKVVSQDGHLIGFADKVAVTDVLRSTLSRK